MTETSPRPRGLFINTEAARCSIHESGNMVYQALRQSTQYSLDYYELSWATRRIPADYDFFVFNYHDQTSMDWLDTSCLGRLPGFKACLVLEVAPHDPLTRVNPDHFDAYIVLDPSQPRTGPKIHPFPRPLEDPPELEPFDPPAIPVIGTFGYPTPGKGFDKIVEAVNREFTVATVRMNIPPADYVSASLQEQMDQTLARCLHIAKPGIEVVVTREFFSKSELIRWCARNTLNCFLYDRFQTGLAATTDQAISSGRPLAVSSNETFRHIHQYLKPYPLRSLQESILESELEVITMRRLWSSRSFVMEFEKLLFKYVSGRRVAAGTTFVLGFRPLLRHPALRPLTLLSPLNLMPSLVIAGGKFIRRFLKPHAVLPGYSNPAVLSFLPLGEDLWMEFFLQGKQDGIYAEAGATNPSTGNATRRFFDQGWRGVNQVATPWALDAFGEARPDDVNLWDAAPISLKKMFERLKPGMEIDFLSLAPLSPNLGLLASNEWHRFRPLLILLPLGDQAVPIKSFMYRQDYVLLINNNHNAIFADGLNRSEWGRKVLSFLNAGSAIPLKKERCA